MTVTVDAVQVLWCRSCGRTWPEVHGQIDTVSHGGVWGHEKITGEFCSGRWWPAVDVVEFWTSAVKWPR